jgi:hypothetical protein
MLIDRVGRPVASILQGRGFMPSRAAATTRKGIVKYLLSIIFMECERLPAQP